MWKVRSEVLCDTEAVHSVTISAFCTDKEAELLASLRQDPLWLPGLSVVAENSAGVVIGHAVFSRCFIDDAPALFLGPVSVSPSYQNQGVGSALVRELIERARDIGEEHLALVGHENYYPRFGFQRASQHGVYLAIDVPDEAIMVMTLNPEHPLPKGIIRAASAFGM